MSSLCLEPMEWDSAVENVCMNWWQQAQANDQEFINQRQCTGVHDYVAKKVFEVVGHKRNIGLAGWAFWNSRYEPQPCIPCLVWANGRSNESQTTPMTQPQGDETWWPCICLNVTPNASGLLPFYCPALAWGNSRPWWVHYSRVRRLVPVPPPPQEAPPTTPPTVAHDDCDSNFGDSSESSDDWVLEWCPDFETFD